MVFTVKADDRAIKRRLSDFERKQFPFARALAVNAIAEGVQADLQAEMRRVFDNPTPWVVGAYRILRRATKTNPTAVVGIPDSGTGRPRWKPLAAEITGGARAKKALELKLSAISGGQFVVPGPGAKLDAYGNVSRGQITQILSRLGAMSDPAKNLGDKTTARLQRKGLIAKGAASDVFVGHAKGGDKRPTGIFQLTGRGQVVALLIFTTKDPTYTRRFDPEAVVTRGVAKHGRGALDRAMARALATAK